MNVLVVMVDQLVPFMTRPYGDPVAQTPKMWRLDGGGVGVDAGGA
jgi:choline-sulfatase